MASEFILQSVYSTWYSKPTTNIFGIHKVLELNMGAQATRLSDVKVKAAKPKEKDYILTDGDGLQMRVRANGSKLWNFNYIHPATKKRINMGLGTFPEVGLAQARKKTVAARELVAQAAGNSSRQPRSTRSKTLQPLGSSSKGIQ